MRSLGVRLPISWVARFDIQIDGEKTEPEVCHVRGKHPCICGETDTEKTSEITGEGPPRQAFKAGIDLSLPAMLNELSAIWEAAAIYPKGTLARLKDHIAICRMSAKQCKLADALNLATILIGE